MPMPPDPSLHSPGAAPPTRRRRGALAVAVVFVAEMLGYVAWRGAITADLFGGDTVNVSLARLSSQAPPERYAPRQLWRRLGPVAAHYFTQNRPTRFSPLTNLYVHMMQLFCTGAPDRLRWARWAMGGFYGLLMAAVFALAFQATRSTAWSLAALVTFQFTVSAITMSYLLFALPYVFVPLATASALAAYLAYRRTRRARWLAAFAAIALIGPWFREFPGAVVFVVAACEVVTFRARRSLPALAVCLPLTAHAVYPSFLPWLVGVNAGAVYGVHEQANTLAQAGGAGLNWAACGQLFVQFPPVLWLVALAGIGGWLWRSRRRPAPGHVRIPVVAAHLRLGWLNAPRVRRALTAAAAAVLLGALAACAVAFATAGRHGGRLGGLHAGVVLLPLAAAALLASLRFGVVLPAFVAMTFPVFLKVRLAEVHLPFVHFAVAVLLVLWVRDLLAWAARRLSGLARAAAVGAVALLLAVAAADHLLNLHACVTTQRELVRANRAMGTTIRRRLPRRAVVLCNFYNLTDVFYYSGFHFEPYETKANCPLGAPRVVDTAEELAALLARNRGEHPVYFLAGEHDFLPGKAAYDAHPFVRRPPGRLTKLATFSARCVSWYADPLRKLTPRRLVSFPGYMDWSDDYTVANAPGLWRRLTYADYALYKLEVGGGDGP
jgi:hypothetical protein